MTKKLPYWVYGLTCECVSRRKRKVKNDNYLTFEGLFTTEKKRDAWYEHMKKEYGWEFKKHPFYLMGTIWSSRLLE